MELIVEQEFKELIPPLSPDEYSGLEESLLAEGCRDALVVWNGVILDGHNRYEICKKHGIEFQTIEKSFSDKDAAKVWIIENQFNRRNLPPYVRGELMLKLKPLIAAKAKENQGQRTDLTSGRILPNVETRKELSKLAGVSHDTISRIEKIKDKAPEDVKAKLRAGAMSINEAYKKVKQIEIDEKRQEMLETIKQAPPLLPDSVKIINADFFDAINDIDDDSIDLLIADPPYMILSEEWDGFKDKGEFLEFTENWLQKVMPKMKATGRVYIFFSQWYEFELYEILHRNDFFGFNFGQKLIWNYRNNIKPSNQYKYKYCYEPIFYLYGKSAPKLNFTPDTYNESQMNVWNVATPQSHFNEGKYHPAQKPLEVYRRIVKTGSWENDVVLDPFAGSGTTGVICRELNRRCILIERDKEYFDILKGRVASVLG